jgi:DNA polymerase-4
VASNKFLAKLASDLDKPNGVTVVPFGDEAAFIAPLPVRKLWGVGPRAAERLEALGLRTIGDVARAELGDLEAELGPSHARHLHAIANARDEREVVTDQGRHSVGSEVTLEHDLRGRAAVEATLKDQCDRVARHLRQAGLVARGLRVKLRYSRGFRLETHQGPLPVACDDSATLIAAALALLESFDVDKPIRLVGAAAYELEPREAPRQLDLFQQQKSDSRSRLEHTLDDIRSRFGDKIDFGRGKGRP